MTSHTKPAHPGGANAVAVACGLWLIALVSDWLVNLQDAVASYPPWLVVGVGLVVLAGICMLLAKVLRVVAVVILVGGVVAAGWLAWKAYGTRPESTVSLQPPAHATFVQIATDAMAADLEPRA